MLKILLLYSSLDNFKLEYATIQFSNFNHHCIYARHCIVHFYKRRECFKFKLKIILRARHMIKHDKCHDKYLFV